MTAQPATQPRTGRPGRADAWLRPGAAVQIDGDTVVFARMGRTVRVRNNPRLAALWTSLGDAVADGATVPVAPGASRAVSGLRDLLSRQGMSTTREITRGTADLASLAQDDSWMSPTSVSWVLRGRPDLVEAAEDALAAWQDDIPLDVDAAPCAVQTAELVVTLAGAGAHLPDVLVLVDGNGFAVLEDDTFDTYRDWRAERPAPGVTGGTETANAMDALNVPMAVAVALHRARLLMAGQRDTSSWHRVAQGSTERRRLPGWMPVPTPADVPSATVRDEEFGWGDVIENLRGGLDAEFAWWDEPHPTDLPQLPQALLHSEIRSLDRTHAVGGGAAHDEAWVATAVAVAASVVGDESFAGVNPSHALADLLRSCALLHGTDRAHWQDTRVPRSTSLAVAGGTGPMHAKSLDLGWGVVVRLQVGHRDGRTVTATGLGPGRTAAMSEATRAVISRLQMLSYCTPSDTYRFAHVSACADAVVHAFVVDRLSLGTEAANRFGDQIAAGDADAWDRMMREVADTFGVTAQLYDLGSPWRESGITVGSTTPHEHSSGISGKALS